MAETIDSLLVSLGLETDAKSFQKANDAIKGVKDGVLQLAAAAGVGFGLKSLTVDLAKSTLEMDRLSRITGFTLKQINNLRYAMRRSGLNPDSANKLVQDIPAWRQAAAQSELGTKAYWNGAFNPTVMADKSKSDQEVLEYVIDSYGKMNNDQRRTLRSGLGLGENDDITRLFEGGISGIRTAAAEFEKLYQPIDPALIDSANKLNQEMAILSTNFENLQRQIGGPLLASVNDFLNRVNEFTQENQNEIKTVVEMTANGDAYNYLMDDANRRGIDFRNKLRDWGVLSSPKETFIPSVNMEKYQPAQHGQSATKGILSDGLLDNENVRRYLNVISKSEGTAGYMNNGYNTMFGGDQFSDMNDHPRVLKEFTQTDGKKNKTTAAGRYQFTQTSWDEAAAALGLTDFSARSQDMAALYLIQRAGQLENVVSGNFSSATAGLGGVWASLPSSTYAQPKHSYDAMENFYAMNGTPPTIPERMGAGGAVTVNQNNNVTINAAGADASEIDNRLANAFTDYSRQARDMMDTEHY